MTVKNPKEIGKDQYDRNQQISKWVSTMFSNPKTANCSTRMGWFSSRCKMRIMLKA